MSLPIKPNTGVTAVRTQNLTTDSCLGLYGGTYSLAPEQSSCHLLPDDNMTKQHGTVNGIGPVAVNSAGITQN